MFKIGLISQAKADFEMILNKYPKELIIKYNYALTLFQLGQYKQSQEILDSHIQLAMKQINKEGFDY